MLHAYDMTQWSNMYMQGCKLLYFITILLYYAILRYYYIIVLYYYVCFIFLYSRPVPSQEIVMKLVYLGIVYIILLIYH